MYIERFIHDADKSKLHDFLLSEKLTENLVYGYAEQDIVYRRIESEKSYIKMRAKKYVDIKDNIAMITLHNVKRTYRSVMEMKRELQKNESDKKKHSKGLTIDKLNALSYEICKKYQWVAMPLALHGVVAKKDGTTVEIALGEDPSDPVIGISDLLPHLGKKQMEKRGNEVVEGEDLNILVGSIPLSGEEKEPVKKQILQLLKEKYNIEETDFISAELEAVPAGNARNYGLDESMIMGYGQDDRVCAYPSYRAMFELGKPQYTCVCLLVDKEEIGSVGATGMHSRFFENAVAEIMDAAGDYSELKVRRALQGSRMLSSDVSAAYDPNYPTVMEKKNSAFFGKGLTFNKFTGSRGKSGSNDANAEYIARIRKILDENEAAFQTAELGKVDEGGGGTIAYILANYGMEVIDCGVAVQNMHAPFEVTSKADIYEAFKGYLAFLEEMGEREF